MLTQRRTKQFTRDIRRIESRGKDLSKLKTVIDILCEGQPLPEQYRDHPLKGKWKGFRDCHIEDDWVLVYGIENDKLLLVLSRTGTHSDLNF